MKTAINTRTQEEYDALMEYFDGKKTQWYADRKASSENYWTIHREDMCISYNMYLPEYISYARVGFYKKQGYEIIPFTEFAKANIVEEPDWKSKYEEALSVIYLAKGALSDIVNWDDEIEDAFGDQGMRARGPLNQINDYLTKHKDLTEQ